MWPSQRVLSEEKVAKSVPGETVMEGLEHLGQYVFEMTQTKMAQLRQERGLPPVTEELEPLGTGKGEVLAGNEEDEGEDVEVVAAEGFEAEEDWVTRLPKGGLKMCTIAWY